MEAIIQKIMDLCQREIIELFCSSERLTIRTLEVEVMKILKARLCELIQAYIEAMSVNIHEDKHGRRKAGLVLERKGDVRRILTQLGELWYERDYYLDKNQQRYRYPIDEILEVGLGQRISDSLGRSQASS